MHNSYRFSPDCRECRPWAGVTDHLAVGIGTQLLGIVPGRVSTECDAHLSYDTQGTIDKVSRPSVQLVVKVNCYAMLISGSACLILQALKIVDLYGKQNVDVSKQVYIKVSFSTYQFSVSSPGSCSRQSSGSMQLLLIYTSELSNMTMLQIASTWEGIRACEYLQKQGISCNMTLLFSFAQVRAPKLLPDCLTCSHAGHTFLTAASVSLHLTCGK